MCQIVNLDSHCLISFVGGASVVDSGISTGRSIFLPAKACAFSTLYVLCLTFEAFVTDQQSWLADLCIAFRYDTWDRGSTLWLSGFVRRIISARVRIPLVTWIFFSYSWFLCYGFRVARLCLHVPNIHCPANCLLDFANNYSCRDLTSLAV